jgi:hypothetical protein
MDLDLPICATCGAQYGSERTDCPICLDERQYVGWDGQRWTTLARLQAEGHRGRVVEEGPGVTGVGAEPPTAIGQRALVVSAPGGNVLWDMITYIDDELVDQVSRLGRFSSIAVSHPHFYGSMVEWAHALGAPVYIHEKDRRWVARPDNSVVFWSGDTLSIGEGLTLVNVGVHFDGGQVLYRAGGPDEKGALFSGDIVGPVMDRRWVSFMYSFPNYIPERPRKVRRALELLAPLHYDTIYGAWWGRVMRGRGDEAVRRSADRYLGFALDDG